MSDLNSFKSLYNGLLINFLHPENKFHLTIDTLQMKLFLLTPLSFYNYNCNITKITH